VVVGVGESPSGTAALAWARDLCEREQWHLEVVTGWPDSGQAHVHEAPGHFSLARYRAVDALNAALVAARIEIDAPWVAIHVENSDPVEALVEHSRGARLLVVGASDSGRSRRAGQAPVSDRCRDRAACPVVVVDVEKAA